MAIPSYFGEAAQTDPVQIAAPPVMPSQPSQAIAPQGGIAPVAQAPETDYSADVPSRSAQNWMSQQQDIQAARSIGNEMRARLGGKLNLTRQDREQTAGQIGEIANTPPKTANEVALEKALNDPAYQHLLGHLAFNGKERRTQMIEHIKTLENAVNNDRERTLTLMGHMKDLGTTEATVRGQMANQDKADNNLDAREKSLAERFRHAQAEEAHQKRTDDLAAENLKLRQMLTPARINALNASAGLHGVQAQTGQATLPFAASQAQAKLSLTKNNAAAVAPRTSAMMAGATGGQPNQAMMGQAGMLVPPPPEVASGSLIQPGGMDTGGLQLPLNPKASAQIQHTQQQTNAGAIKTEAETIKLRNRATNTVKALLTANPAKAKVDYWKSPAGREEYARMAKETPHQAEALLKALREGNK